MDLAKKFKDGIQSLTRKLSNTRNAQNTNVITSTKLSDAERNEIYKTGIGNKIARIKAETAMKEGFVFDNKDDKEFYDERLSQKIEDAVKFMIAFGRSALVIVEKDQDDLSKPLGRNINIDNLVFHVFDGYKITVAEVETDLTSDRYKKPNMYNINGHNFHHSRVIDFKYVKPIEDDMPDYNYGGISEYDLIVDQLIADGIIERAVPMVLDKSSVPVYKIKGFKQALQNKQEDNLINYFASIESARSIAGAVLMDSEDGAEMLTQTLSNLSEADQIGLRRIAMVTSIPLSILVGENVKGLNSSGENEMSIFNSMISGLQKHYIHRPVNQLMSKLGLEKVKHKQPEQLTPIEKADLETKYLDNAVKIATVLGGDHNRYLKERGLEIQEDFEDSFKDEEDEDED